jgi:hypothetical protein
MNSPSTINQSFGQPTPWPISPKLAEILDEIEAPMINKAYAQQLIVRAYRTGFDEGEREGFKDS